MTLSGQTRQTNLDNLIRILMVRLGNDSVADRWSPSTKFDAGIGGTFRGEPGRRSRPADTNHDSTEP
jgi:hypothetical protein